MWRTGLHPGTRILFGASVLLPAGNDYEYLHYFVDTTFKNIQSIAQSEDEIQVLNGTKVPGLAYEGLNTLSRFCLPVVYYGNASNRELETSTIYYEPDEEGNPPQLLSTIEKLMPDLATQAGIPEEYLQTERRMSSTIVVELGQDYLDKRLDDPFKSLPFFAPPASSTTDDEDETETTDPDSETPTETAETTSEEPVETPAETPTETAEN